MNTKYEAVIGLEVHAQLLTNSKIFCGCSTKFGNKPNSNTCPVCLGHPGVLPVLNKKVVEFTTLMGLATNCKINEHSIFARKNYFYPDLPKGYQISQYEEPICEHGFIEVNPKNYSSKKIGITRIHMEEDAGKSIHDQSTATLVDVNRCGIPLMEIVSDPDIRTAEEAYLYLSKIKHIVQYLEICDGNMEEGSLRCDANVSVRIKGEEQLGTKTEIKNMNSFKNVEKAIDFEIRRQIEIIEEGGKIVQQTLLWNADLEEAYPMRGKEEAHDYRYFPDPDLMPVEISDKMLEGIKSSLPELPESKVKRFIKQFSLPEYDALVLTQNKDTALYFEAAAEKVKDFKSLSNWVMGEILKILNEKKISAKEFSIPPKDLAALVNFISDGTISGKIAKEVWNEMLISSKSPEEIINQKGLMQISDESALQEIIYEVLTANQKQVDEYLSGSEKVFGFFIGQCMKLSGGKANPRLLNSLLKKNLEILKK